MSNQLKDYVIHNIYNKSPNPPTETYTKFRILVTEDSPYENDVRAYPFAQKEHLFSLLWDIHDQDTLSATLIPSEEPFTFEKHFSPGSRTLMHSHEYLELFYIVDGEYRQRILGNEYVFKKGEVCLIDKNCLHQEILSGNSATILFLGITDSIFDDLMTRQIPTERITSFLNMALLEQKTLQQYLHFRPQADKNEEFESCLLSLLHELEHQDAASSLICQGLLLRMFLILGAQYDFSLSRQLRKKMNWLLFDEITSYMESNLNHMSIQMLCDEFHFQEDYFNRLLKSRTGLTYTEYLQLLRLRKAEDLLIHTQFNIDHIVEEVGYKNKGYFYKIFTERHQLTPAQFRKKMLDK